MMKSTNHKKNYKPLVVLMFIFMFPVISGWFLYHYHDYFKFNTINHGTLVKNPIDVKYIYVNLPNGGEKRWRVIHVFGATCDAQCDKINYQLGQVKKALGKNTDRVSIIFMPDKNVESLKNSFEQQNEKNYQVANKIYLVDPIGNLFMYYPDNTDPMNVLKDLKKVLEVSQIG